MINEEKAALLLLTLEEETAAEIMKNFTAVEISRIGEQMKRISNAKISGREVNIIAREFCELASEEGRILAMQDNVTESIIVRALGEEKAQGILNKIEVEGHRNLENPISKRLSKVDPKILVDFTRMEHPQTIALILAHLKRQQAAEALEKFPAEMRIEIVKRMATLGSVPHEVIKEIAQTLETEIFISGTTADQQVGGVGMAAEIMNLLGRESEATIMESLDEIDPNMAEEIRSLMFTFEDVLALDDRDMQELLREISSEDLARALKIVDEEMREKVYGNMTKRGAEMLKEDIELMPPTRLSEVENSQRSILDIVKRLEGEDKIVIKRGAEEDKFV